MIITGRSRLPGLCTGGGVARVRVRKPPQQQYRQMYNSVFADDRAELSSSNGSDEMSFNGGVLKPESEGGNKVMVVVDPSLDAKGALQWVLSHTVQSQDTVILLHVVKPSGLGAESNRDRAYELLCSMKETCQNRKPGVQVMIAVLEGKDKGITIVEEAKQQKASLLVLGQRKQSLTRRLWMMWSLRKRRPGGVVDYCIQNANCMAIAVRRKSTKYGGYLITTKRHKNFWLLA